MSPSKAPELLAELKVGSQDWANVTSYLESENVPVVITRGKSDANSQASPAQLSFQLDDDSGVFSPKNPSSPVYGLIGRNTPVRISIGKGKFGMVTTDSGNGNALAADSAGTSITGDIDIRVDLEILASSTRTWAASTFDVASKWADTDPQRSWMMTVTGGQIRFTWWALGTVASQRSLLSSTTIPAPATGRRAIRVTLDVDNGAAGCTATFYTAATIAGPWTQLGTTVTSAGTTAIFDGTASTRVGAAASAAATPAATFYAAEIRNGINGTVVASPDFTTQPLDPVPFAFSNFNDAQSNNWSFTGTSDAARIWYGDVDVRAVQELASKSPRWELTNAIKHVPATANGMLRRLGQGNDPAPSGLRDFVLSNLSTLTSYFPLSGAEGTSYSINLGRVGTNSYRFFKEGFPIIKYGVDMGAEWLGTGLEITGTGASFLRADVAAGDDNFAIDFVFQSKAMGVLQVRVFDYLGNWWNLKLQDAANSGKLQVSYFDATGGTGLFTNTAAGPFSALLGNNDVHTCRFKVTTGLGPSQSYAVYLDGNDTPVDSGGNGGIVQGWAATSVYRLLYGLEAAGMDVVNIAHLALWSVPLGPSIPAFSLYDQAARGYAGETAHARMTRVAATNSIPLVIDGAAADTTVMGAQHAESALTQLRDAEGTDLGILTEARDQLALLYRTRASMYNQTPALTINYAAKQLSPPFEPIEDDQTTVNDVTVSRRDGDSREAVKLTGPLSVQAPPAGVGRYRDQVTVNVQTDDQLDPIAGWLLALGTVDEFRFPQVTVDLGAPDAAALAAAAPAVDIGDLIVITGAAAVGMPDDIRLLVLQINETIENLPDPLVPNDTVPSQIFVFTCMPVGPFEVFVVDDTGSRISTGETAQLNASMTTGATSMSVLSADAVTLWTTAGGDMPIPVMVSGEEMSITAITGTTPGVAQTATVVRSVNGVVKTHNAGEIVRLKRDAPIAL